MVFLYHLLRQNGISLPPQEEIPEDQWQRNYKLRKTIERGELPLSRASVDVARFASFRVMQECSDVGLSSTFQIVNRELLEPIS